MPIATSTFSIKTNYRLEVSAYIVGQDSAGFYVQEEIGIRRLSGVGDAGSLTLLKGTYWTIGGAGSGGDVTYTYDLTSATYSVLSKRTYQVAETLLDAMGRTLETYAQSTVTNANPQGVTPDVRVSLTFPAASTATFPSFSPTTFNAGSSITVSLPRQVGTYTHDLFYSFGADVNVPVATGVGTSYSYTPPTSLLAQIPEAVEGAYTVMAITRTASGAEVGRNSFTGTLRAPASAAPTVSAYSVEDTNTVAAAEIGKFVQGVSVLKLNSVTASAEYGAVITDRRLAIEGSQLRIDDTRALLNAGTVPVTARAWDSRGLEGSLPGTIEVLGYSAPLAYNGRAVRSDAVGNPDADGEYISVLGIPSIRRLVNGTERNVMTIRVFTKLLSDTVWTARNDFNPTTSIVGNYLRYTDPVVVSGGAVFDADNSYAVRMEVSDKFNTFAVEYTVATADVTLDLAGENVGVGKMHELGRLDVGGATYSEGLYSFPQTISHCDLAMYSGQYATLSGTTGALPPGETGWGYLEVVRTGSTTTDAESIMQRYVGISGGTRWHRKGLVFPAANAVVMGDWEIEYRPMSPFAPTVTGLPAGMVTAEYEMRGKMVHVEYEFNRTSSGSPTATVELGLPLTPASSITRQPGTGLFYLAGGSQYIVQPRYTGSNFVNVNFITVAGSAMGAGSNLSGSYPTGAAHGVGTRLHLSMDYKAA